jgi:hypothetical protein
MARSGGSGGGAQWPYNGCPPGQGVPGQGFPGGTGIGQAYAYGLHGGGGGASECGQVLVTKVASRGGNGKQSTISGVATYYAGGGGGGGFGTDHYVPSAPGGLGGGGCGGWPNNACSGNVNSGGGGGGAGVPNPPTSVGCPGGSGIVIISYPLPVTATGGTITCCLGNAIHTFTSSGNLCVSPNYTYV